MEPIMHLPIVCLFGLQGEAANHAVVTGVIGDIRYHHAAGSVHHYSPGGISSTHATFLVAIVVIIISLTGFYVYYTAPHDPIPPETTPAASIIPTEEVIEVAPVGWLAEREELQEELKRVYGALKALEEHSAEDRKLLARMRDRELNNTMESSRVGQQLEQYIVQLEGEVRALQAIPCSEQPVEEDAHVKEAECGSDYIVGAALILLALVEAISSRVDARLQVYSIEANEKVYRLTTTLKEVREACEELCGQKEAIVKELEEALRDKEENALALADSLATLASSREEFTRFTEQQAKKELVLLDRSADSQSAMSSARSMASQAYDLKWPEGAAVLHLKHQQQQPMAGLEGRLIEGCIREVSAYPPSNISSAVCCYYPNEEVHSAVAPIRTLQSGPTTPSSKHDIITPAMVPSNYTLPGKANTIVQEAAYGTTAAAAVVDDTRYDSFEEESSWVTADSVRRVPTPSSVTESSSTIQEEEGPSLLRVETLSGEEGGLQGCQSIDEGQGVTNIEELVHSNTLERTMSPVKSVNRLNSIDGPTCLLRTPRGNSPRKYFEWAFQGTIGSMRSTPASTPSRASQPKFNVESSINRRLFESLTFTTDPPKKTGYSKVGLGGLPNDGTRRRSTGSMDYPNVDRERSTRHRYTITGINEGGHSRRSDGCATSVTPTSSSGSECSTERPRWRD